VRGPNTGCEEIGREPADASGSAEWQVLRLNNLRRFEEFYEVAVTRIFFSVNMQGFVILTPTSLVIVPVIIMAITSLTERAAEKRNRRSRENST
jgi:hypothetical protein